MNPPVSGGVQCILTNTPVGWRVQRWKQDSNCTRPTPSPRTRTDPTCHLLLTLIVILWGKSYHYPYLTYEATEAQRGWGIWEGHIWVMWPTQWQKRKKLCEVDIKSIFYKRCILFVCSLDLQTVPSLVDTVSILGSDVPESLSSVPSLCSSDSLVRNL